MFPYNDVSPVCEFLLIVYTAKNGSFEVLSLHHPLPSVTVDRRQL